MASWHRGSGIRVKVSIHKNKTRYWVFLILPVATPPPRHRFFGGGFPSVASCHTATTPPYIL